MKDFLMGGAVCLRRNYADLPFSPDSRADVAQAVNERVLPVLEKEEDTFTYLMVQQMEPEQRRVLIAHGHTMNVKYGLLRAQYRAQELNADILLFGHTHVPLVEASSRPMLLNPGSIGDMRRPTYGVLDFQDGRCIPSVFRLEP